MTRSYSLGKRAERQEETRRRIVEAAVELHGTVGPAATSVSQIAERAGVQRHTFYAHFPDERSLHLACSGLFFETNPLPDPAPWGAVANPRERLRLGLSALYAWFEANEGLVACVLRDAEHHAITREMATLRFTPALQVIAGALTHGLSSAERELLPLALSFHTWRTLAREGSLGTSGAVEAMVRAVRGSAGA